MAAPAIPLLPIRRRFPLWWILAAALLAAASVVVHSHAVSRHGADAEAIRKCLDNNGPYQTWRSFDGDTFYRLCRLEDERWGLQAITKEAGEWHEKTAFIRGDGSWKSLLEYLHKLGTRFTGPLP
jgi:hypothetical protein